VAKTVETFGGLDIPVNSTGAVAIAPITEFPWEKFEPMIAVNIRGMFVDTGSVSRLP
jgi:3-oxoacyl-[acyl-carrier protein] reductase